MMDIKKQTLKLMIDSLDDLLDHLEQSKDDIFKNKLHTFLWHLRTPFATEEEKVCSYREFEININLQNLAEKIIKENDLKSPDDEINFWGDIILDHLENEYDFETKLKKVIDSKLND